MNMTAEQQLQWLVDRASISDLLHSFASALDRQDWAAYVGNYADGGFIELPDPKSEAGATFRMEKHQMLSLVPKSLGRYRATHHISSNHMIAIDGDSATTRSYLQAVHVSGALTEHWTAGGWYDCTLTRTDAGWKFASVRLTPVWVAGEIADIKPEP
jgi:SnoaL-like protein